MTTEAMYVGIFQDLDRYIKTEIARRLSQHGLAGGIVDARYIAGSIPVATVSLPASASRTVTAAENIGAGKLVGFTTEGKAVLADAGDRVSAKAFALTAFSAGSTGAVYAVGILSGLTGRTVGAGQYLSTDGDISETPPSTSNYLVQAVGTAVSATEVAFQPQMGIWLA